MDKYIGYELRADKVDGMQSGNVLAGGHYQSVTHYLDHTNDTFIHSGLTAGDVWYYSIRAFNRGRNCQGNTEAVHSTACYSPTTSAVLRVEIPPASSNVTDTSLMQPFVHSMSDEPMAELRWTSPSNTDQATNYRVEIRSKYTH